MDHDRQAGRQKRKVSATITVSNSLPSDGRLNTSLTTRPPCLLISRDKCVGPARLEKECSRRSLRTTPSDESRARGALRSFAQCHCGVVGNDGNVSGLVGPVTGCGKRKNKERKKKEEAILKIQSGWKARGRAGQPRRRSHELKGHPGFIHIRTCPAFWP